MGKAEGLQQRTQNLQVLVEDSQLAGLLSWAELAPLPAGRT